MRLKKLSAAFLAAVMLFGIVPLAAFATETDTVIAEIMNVYGGADGIISMTFDDGYYSTAVVLEELLEKYDLKASLMLIVEKVSRNAPGYVTQALCNELFTNGYLEPQSHSMTHANLNEIEVSPEQAPELYLYEIVESKELLEQMFPNNDILVLATPYGRINDDALECAKENYYAVRATTSGVQSLDPDFSDESGSWMSMHSPVVYKNEFVNAEDPEDAQWTWIKECIDRAENGWYIPITHRVGDVESTELSYSMAEKMFAYIASLRDEGNVWVTTYSEATKYVRERQNSAVRAYSVDGSIYADVTMADMTEDGLPLDADVFNTPLTVRIEVPAEYGTVYYTTAEKEYSAQAFSEGSKNYVYVNVVPNSGPVELRITSTHYFTQWDKYDEELHKRTCIDCGLADYGEHVWNDGEIIKEPTHMKTGSKSCTCLLCSDDAVLTVKKTEEHTFSEKNEVMQFKASEATCTSGVRYYYSCRCGEAGTETYEVGEPRAHKFGQWSTLEAATDTESGLEARECECGEWEYKIIPAFRTGGSVSVPIFIGVTVGAVLLSLAVGCVVAMLILKKKNNH